MTKKDYKEFAMAFRDIYAEAERHEVPILDEILNKIENILENDNPRFDIVKFENAIYKP